MAGTGNDYTEQEEKSVSAITFEEVMFTIMSATQDTFKSYLSMEIYAGHVERKVEPLDSDIVGIVGVAGERVGYIMFAAGADTAGSLSAGTGRGSSRATCRGSAP